MDSDRGFALVIGLMLVAFGLTGECSASAQDPHTSARARVWASSAQDVLHEDDRLVSAMARVCVAEAGFDADRTGDCAAIVHLLLRRAARLGWRPMVMVRRYASAHFDAGRTDPRAWIVGLNLEGTQPPRWPSSVPWRVYRPQWLGLLEHVRAVMRGEVADPCGGQSDHWGGAMDDERALRNGLRRIDCGPRVRNHFWCVGRRVG